jgi:hypothetical protein
MEKRSRRRTRDLVTQAASQGLFENPDRVRADIHNGQEHKRSMQGPDTDAQDHPLHLFTSGLQRTAPKRAVRAMSAIRPIASELRTSRDVSNCPTAEVRRFTQITSSARARSEVAPYDRVGLAVRCAVVLSIPGHDQRWHFLSTSSARSACTVITNSLLITSITVRSVSITNVTRCRGIIGIHPLTPNRRATT